jgi:hypothetical protein
LLGKKWTTNEKKRWRCGNGCVDVFDSAKLIDFNSSAASTYGFLLEFIANINATQQLLNAQKSYKTTSPPQWRQ